MAGTPTSFFLGTNVGSIDENITKKRALNRLIASKMQANRRLQALALKNADPAVRARARNLKILPSLHTLTNKFAHFPEKRHIPYIPIIREYKTLKVGTGVSQAGGEITFEYHDTNDYTGAESLNITLGPVRTNTGLIPARTAEALNVDVVSNYFTDGASPLDVADGKYKYELVNTQGLLLDDEIVDSPYAAGQSISNRLNYADFPGEVLIEKYKHCSMQSENSVLKRDAIVMMRKTQLAETQRESYKNGMGQQIAKQGLRPSKKYNFTSDQALDETTRKNISDGTDVDSTINDSYTVGQEKFEVFDGLQVPKLEHKQITLRIPGQHSYSKYTDDRFAQVNAEQSEQEQTFELCNTKDILFEKPNMFVKTTHVHDVNGVIVTTVSRTPYLLNKNDPESWPRFGIADYVVKKAELIVEVFYLEHNIHTILMDRTINRIYKLNLVHVKEVFEAEGEECLTTLRLASTGVIVSFTPSKQKGHADTDRHVSAIVSRHSEGITAVASMGISALVSDIDYTYETDGGSSYTTMTPLVTKVGLKAYDVDLYELRDADVYDTFTSYAESQNFFRQSHEYGFVYIFMFEYLHGKSSLSGYLNLSKARELFLMWESSWISSTNGARIVAWSVSATIASQQHGVNSKVYIT